MMTSIEALKYIRDHAELWARPKGLFSDPRAVAVVKHNSGASFSIVPSNGHLIPLIVTGLMLDSEWEVVNPETVLEDLRKLSEKSAQSADNKL